MSVACLTADRLTVNSDWFRARRPSTSRTLRARGTGSWRPFRAPSHFVFFFGSGYFASRGKIAPSYFAIWRQNSPNSYFAASAKIALSLILTLTLTQTLTLILTQIPTLIRTLTQTLTQTEEKHYFASRGKITTSFFLLGLLRNACSRLCVKQYTTKHSIIISIRNHCIHSYPVSYLKPHVFDTAQ